MSKLLNNNAVLSILRITVFDEDSSLHKIPGACRAARFVRHVLLLHMPLFLGSSRLPFGFLDVLDHIQMCLALPVGIAGALGTQCKIAGHRYQRAQAQTIGFYSLVDV